MMGDELNDFDIYKMGQHNVPHIFNCWVCMWGVDMMFVFYTQHPYFAFKKLGYGVVMVNLEGNTSIVLQLGMFVSFITQESPQLC